jgi:hypothetical protein
MLGQKHWKLRNPIMPNSASTLVGVVQELWRYPVKSMLGEQLTATEIMENGLVGDRAYALRDTSDGKIATAKNPRKWPNLFDYEAALTGAAWAGEKLPPARITLPDGTTMLRPLHDDHACSARSTQRPRDSTHRGAS